MRKNRFLSIALGVLLAVSNYAQTNENETGGTHGFFAGAGMVNSIFTSDKLAVYPDFDLLKLNPAKIGVYYEIPLGIGNFFAGLEGGYASGSNFGGAGNVSFLPINANATFAFNIADILYVGPSVKAGVLGLLGHEKYSVLPLLGAGLDLEIRYKYFPLSIYGSGGVNAYPTTNGINVLPVVEAGIRFPRGAFGRPSAARSVTSVTVNPDAATVNQGGTQQFRAAVNGVNNPSQNVTWSVTGGSTGTSINSNGLLTIGANQIPGNLTVTATSTADTTKKGIATVTVPLSLSGADQGGASRPPFQFTANPPTTRIITLEDGRQGLLSCVYFEPDTEVLIERYRPILEEAGRLLAANPQLQVLLRAYAAPFKTEEGRYAVSMDRGIYCRDLLIQYYGIEPARITIESYGSAKSPLDAVKDDWETYRCVELIIME